jgi:hypothetical protein
MRDEASHAKEDPPMAALTNSSIKLSPELELERIVPLQEAAKLQSTSVDTIKRRHRDKIIELSPRRLGMKLKDALIMKP